MDKASEAHLIVIEELNLVEASPDAFPDFCFAVIEVFRTTLQKHIKLMHVSEQNNLFFRKGEKKVGAGEPLKEGVNFFQGKVTSV